VKGHIDSNFLNDVVSFPPTFTEEITKFRQKSKLNGDSAGDEFYKLVLNESYRYDIMNEEKFSKCFVWNSVTTESKQYSSHF
jgi:hypothetical protein